MQYFFCNARTTNDHNNPQELQFSDQSKQILDPMVLELLFQQTKYHILPNQHELS